MHRGSGRNRPNGHHQPLIFEFQRKRPRDTHAALNPLSTEVQVADAVFFGQRDRRSASRISGSRQAGCAAVGLKVAHHAADHALEQRRALGACLMRPALHIAAQTSTVPELCALPVSADVKR